MAQKKPASNRGIDFLASGFYSGHLPIAPASWGSLVACFIAGGLFWCFPVLKSFEASAILAIMVSVAAIYIAHQAWKAQIYGFGNDDPKQIVIDEFAGYFVSIVGESGPISLGLAFVLFRFFDVVKPFPARAAEKLPGGWGIVLDDVIAGVYTAVSLRIVEAVFF